MAKKVLQGLVVCLGGYENPKRGQLREISLKLGAQYRPDYTDDVTHLCCAFAGDTPKIKSALRVGTACIVDGDWLRECEEANQRVPVDDFLLYPAPQASKPDKDQDKPPNFDDDSDEDDVHQPRPTKKARANEDEDEEGNAGSETVQSETADPQVQKWIEEDLKATKKFLVEQAAEQGNDLSADEVDDIAQKGILVAFEVAKESAEEAGSLKDFDDKWIGPLPKGLVHVQKESERNDDSVKELIKAIEDIQHKYKAAMKAFEKK